MKNKHTKTIFQMDPQKQYIRKFRIYPFFLYCYLDKWLKSMSSKGWHITHCGIFSFWFEKGKPANKEYFTYGLSTQEGNYSISLRHPYLENKYGLKKEKSKINSNTIKTYKIVEIDVEKIDVINDVGYRELVRDRNNLYFRYFFRNLSIVLIAVFIAVVLHLLNI